MGNKIGFIKIRSNLMMKPEYVKKRHPNASFTPSTEFSNMVWDSNERFREPIITFIDELIKNDWAIMFTPYTDTLYDAHIYCESEGDFEIIVGVIKDKLKDIKFNEYYMKGSVNKIDT